MSKDLLLGIDIGGTKTNIGILTTHGKILQKEKIPTNAKSDTKKILANLYNIIDRHWQENIVGIGVGIAGLVDPDRGIFLQGPNFASSFRNVPLADMLEKKYKRPVKVDNDAHCFILGEHARGAGRGYDHLVGITIGTGIGGGIIVNKKLYRGGHNGAGEFGHTTFLGPSEPCSCGGIGHLEASASGSAMCKMYAALTGRQVTAREIENLVEENDARAIEVVEKARRALAAGIANIIHTLDPEAIILGGGMVGFKFFINRLTKELHEHLTFNALKLTPVMPGELGPDAQVIGAALQVVGLAKKLKKS